MAKNIQRRIGGNVCERVCCRGTGKWGGIGQWKSNCRTNSAGQAASVEGNGRQHFNSELKKGPDLKCRLFISIGRCCRTCRVSPSIHFSSTIRWLGIAQLLAGMGPLGQMAFSCIVIIKMTTFYQFWLFRGSSFQCIALSGFGDALS